MSKNHQKPNKQSAEKLLNILHSRAWDSRNKKYGWTPFPGQVKAGKAVLVDGKKKLFLQCGRKFGKTEFVIYLLVRWAILNPESTCAYFGDKRVNARKIIWKRLKTFIPTEFLLDGSVDRAFKEQDLTVRLWNGSEIVVDGTSDEDSGRGVEPHLVVYDEYKDHKPGFHKGMEPNLEVNKAIVVFIGTPPDHENHFTETAEEIKNDPEGAYIESPSTEGPVYGTPEGLIRLAKIKKKYADMGDLAYFMREYEAKFVLGGTGAVFPMWDKSKHVWSEADIKSDIAKDITKMEWYMVTDPGTTTCHATLVACLNPYTKRMYILNEIYETNPEETSTRRIWPRIEQYMQKWAPHLPISDQKWYKGYDEAAAWFAREVQDSFGNIGLAPTNKKLMNKENGLSLIKDQLLEKKLIISANCEKLIWEIERYVKDSNGNLPKKNDHAIDCVRYLNSAANYQFSGYTDEPDRFKEMGWRGIRPADEYDLEDIFEEPDF